MEEFMVNRWNNAVAQLFWKDESNFDTFDFCCPAVSGKIVSIGNALIVKNAISFFQLSTLHLYGASLTLREALAVKGQSGNEKSFDKVVCFSITTVPVRLTFSLWGFLVA
uniref:Uncharacterized protein n=1 Tax=mine drainage metagenome TaxID=410659 RepID=E6PQI2_9ZZZZ